MLEKGSVKPETYYFSSQDYHELINGVIDIKNPHSSKNVVSQARKRIKAMLCKNFYSPKEQQKIFSFIKSGITNIFQETSDENKLYREKGRYFPANVYQIFENYVHYAQIVGNIAQEDLEDYYTVRNLIENQCFDLLEKYVEDPEDLETLGEMLSKGDLSHIWKMGKIRGEKLPSHQGSQEKLMTINKELHEFSQAILKKCEEKRIMEQVSPQNSEEIQVQIDEMIEIIKTSLQKQGFSDGEISTFLVTLFQGKYILSIDSKMNGGV